MRLYWPRTRKYRPWKPIGYLPILEYENQLQKTLSGLEKTGQVKNQLLLQEKENRVVSSWVKQNCRLSSRQFSEQSSFNFETQQSTKAIRKFGHCAVVKTRFNSLLKCESMSLCTWGLGDFIFRECDENGYRNHFHLFEMKNEADGTEEEQEWFYKKWTRTVGRKTVSMRFGDYIKSGYILLTQGLLTSVTSMKDSHGRLSSSDWLMPQCA